MSQLLFPWMYIADPTVGRPVALGQMFFGLPDLDPEIPANQIQARVKQEDGTIIDVPQPILLNAGGVPSYAGSPVIVDIEEGEFSWKVLSQLGAQVYYNENNTPLVINGSSIEDDSISSDKIISLDGDKIDDGTITEDKLAFTISGVDEPYKGFGVSGTVTFNSLFPQFFGLTTSKRFGVYDFLAVPDVVNPEAINIKEDFQTFMVLQRSGSLVKQFDSVEEFEINNNISAVTAKSLNMAGELVSNATCHWMPKAGNLSVGGGDDSSVYLYNWAIPWDADSGVYSNNSFNHSVQTGGSIDSLWIDDDFTKMYLTSDNFIYEYTFGVVGDLSTAVFIGSFDITTLPVQLPNPLIVTTEFYTNHDVTAMQLSPNGTWLSLVIRQVINSLADHVTQPVSVSNHLLYLSTAFDISTAADYDTPLLVNGGMGMQDTWYPVNNGVGGLFPSPVPYLTGAPWQDRRGVTGMHSPDGVNVYYVGYSTDVSVWKINASLEIPNSARSGAARARFTGAG